MQITNDQQKDTLKQLVTFTISEETYGLEILKVQEIVRLPQVTKLPKAPAFVKGVIDLRGSVIPILDLREKFGIDTIAYSEKTRVIILETSGKKIGIIVDTVSKVIQVEEKDIAPPPNVITGGDNQFISGVIRLEDKLIILLDIGNMFSEETISQLHEIDAELAGV
ncbi:MAG TPA: purine-binding chemotaxis protein CheW [Spirochaetes bacterium]|nr:purine-binding chemotaxis protein CheW [Spirochaetota bacterium]